MPDNDKLFKDMANIYAERYGAALRGEAERLEQLPGLSPHDARVEQSVRAWIYGKKRGTLYRNLGTLLAACVVLALIVIVPYFGSQNDAAPGFTGGGSGGGANVAESPADVGATDDGAQVAQPPYGADNAASDETEDATGDMAEAGFEVVPLAAPLPYGFEQSGFEQDRGLSIYYIEDIYLDDVVAILERTDSPPDVSGLTEITVGNLTAHGTQTDAYSLLVFRIDDVTYTLTSRHDVNTLVRLAVGLV